MLSTVSRNLRPTAVFVGIVSCTLAARTSAQQKDVSGLPTLRPSGPVAADYLIDPSTFRAGAYRSEAGELVLDNGLIRRTWRLSPNGACVGFDNLMNGQAMLRSVRPEARVTIDGKTYDVGGLIGQPNHAFLKPEWLAAMRADPEAMRFAGFTVGAPKERFAWGRRRHAAPDAKWPPKGVYLKMDYVLPVPRFDASRASGVGRSVLWKDEFDAVREDWTVKKSGAHARVSFANEGKLGEIYGPAGAHCFAERSLPRATALIEATLDPGTDSATSWGPGLAWVFERGIVKVNLRPGDRGVHGQFELRINGRERLASSQHFASKDGGLDVAQTYRLRMRHEGEKLIVDAATEAAGGAVYRRLFELARNPVWGESRAMRIGKMDRTGRASDESSADGKLVRLRVVRAAAYGTLDQAAVERARRKVESARQRAGESAVGVSVHYELYDGVPAMSKWITVHNRTDRSITVDRFVGEELALVEHDNPVETRAGVHTLPPQYLHAETDFAAGGFSFDHANRHVVHWRADSAYTSIVNYSRKQPTLLVCEPTYGPAQRVAPSGTFQGFRTFLLVYGEVDRERRGLALRRMYRTIAPWVTENPLTHHLLTNDPKRARAAIDEAAAVGFEAIIFSFGSGFNMESRDPDYLAKWKGVADYAEEKGIELGTYSLFSSRGVRRDSMIVSPAGQRPTHGRCPSPASVWGQQWLKTVRAFYETTGFEQFENDGPYPNDVDTTARPPFQKGIQDSRWVQFHMVAALYRDLRAKGVYINAPDYYFLNGSNKCGMGYREVNWSLPRAHQVIHTRQNIYDGSWIKTPSMGWMFVPLAQYHGGGAAATIEPLHEHLDHYKVMMESNLGMGVQAHYRGPRLFDTSATRAMVKSVVDWYKKYRDILESDIIHGRRADGRDLDWILHVHPKLETKGMLCVYNPLGRAVTKTIRVNLYYTGLRDSVVIRKEDGAPQRLQLRRDCAVDLSVSVPAGGMAWYTVR